MGPTRQSAIMVFCLLFCLAPGGPAAGAESGDTAEPPVYQDPQNPRRGGQVWADPVQGTVVGRDAEVRDKETANLLVRLEREDGDPVLVDLGSPAQWQAQPIREGDILRVEGQPVRVGDQLRLRAETVAINGGERLSVRRESGERPGTLDPSTR